MSSKALTKGERLALLVALDKRIAPELKDAKDEARLDIMESYAVDGTDRRAILVGGEKVGEVGLSYGKASPFIYAEQTPQALEFLREHGLTEEVPRKGWEEQFELIAGTVVYKPTGEVVGWAGWTPKAPKTAAVRGCKPEDVMRAFGARLEAVDVVALLDGGVQ